MHFNIICVSLPSNTLCCLNTGNVTLEQQYNELMVAFKQQLSLSDILKTQKIHVDAAHLLAFVEKKCINTGAVV